MQVFFIIIAVLGSAYFLSRKTIDPLAVAFGASVVYFAPGFIGTIRFSKGLSEKGAHLGDYASSIAPGAYVCMLIVLTMVIVAAIISDLVPSKQIIYMPGDKYMPSILALIVIISASLSLGAVSTYYLCADKTITLSKIDYWYYWAGYALPLCLVSACMLRQWTVVAFCIVMLAADIFIGFRANTAVCFLSFLVIIGDMLFRDRRSALIYIGILVIGGGSFFLVKEMAYSIKSLYAVNCTAKPGKLIAVSPNQKIEVAGRTNSTDAAKKIAKAVASAKTYTNSIFNSEPFVIQAILNETVSRNFSTPADYIAKQALGAVPGGATIFHIDLGAIPLFSDFFKPKLFMDVPFGMASNPWAQAFAAGGYPLVILFAAIYAGVVGGLGYLFKISRGGVSATMLVTSMWVAFYFHRNDVLTEIGIVKQTVYAAVAALAISSFLVVGWSGLAKLRSAQRLPTKTGNGP